MQMCSVHGYIRSSDACLTGKNQGLHELQELVRKGSCRGVDAWGAATSDGAVIKELRSSVNALVPAGGAWVIANCRAEPTTEHVENPSLADVQPFTDGAGTWVAHNGTVANDRQLAAEIVARGGKLSSTIDSAVLPHLLGYALECCEPEHIAAELHRVEGSYGLLAGRGGVVIAATNFRPLRLLYRPGIGTLVTSLTPEQAGYEWWDRADGDWLAIPPYSFVTIDDEGPTAPVSLRRDTDTPPRCLVVCSGGLDSTVVATKEVAEYGAENVELLHFTYGCKAQAREVEAVTKIADALRVQLTVVDMGHLFTQLAPSSLTTGGATASGEAGAEFAHEWVPARNLVLMACATAIAEARGFSQIALGINIEEAGAYPDNEQEFIYRLNQLMPYAVGPNKQVELRMPVGGLTKREIVQLGVECSAPLDLTWSCYEGGELHCGDCGPCFMRQTAFQMTAYADPMEYA